MAVRLSGNEKIGLISNLTTMLAAGIPIYEVVESLLEEAKGSQKLILETLRDDLVAGNQVYVTFAKFPLVFDKVVINLIKAAEEAGTLETTLKDLKANIRQEMEFSDKLKSAMIYPLLIMIVFIGVLLMMLVVVIPKMTAVFERMNVELPLPTKVLIWMSNLLLHQTLTVIVVTLVTAATFIFLYRQKREVITGALFSLPLLSKLITQVDITRFARSLHLLLASGLPITFALELAQDVVQKKELSQAIAAARQSTIEGHQFSAGLKIKKQIFPSTVLKLMDVGEKTGKLEKSMQDISEFMSYEVEKSLKNTTALLEPLMLIIVGVAVGGMMLAIIAPIYGMISSVGSM